MKKKPWRHDFQTVLSLTHDNYGNKKENGMPNEKYIIVHRGIQSPTWKNTVPPKEPIPT